MRQQARSNSSLLTDGGDVGVPNQIHVPDLLQAHHSNQLSALLISPERDTVIDFMAQLVLGHVWFRPAIFRDDAFVSARAIVDDGPNQLKVAVITAADHAYAASQPGTSIHAGDDLDLQSSNGSRDLTPVLRISV